MDKIVIIGYGGHAKSVVDSIQSSTQFEIAGYTDIGDKGGPLSYLGNDDNFINIFKSGICYAAFGIGFMGKSTLRDKLYYQLKDIGFKLPVIRDTSATIAYDAKIGDGSFIGKKAIVNADSRIGKMCIINSGAIIEHENYIGDFTHVAVGAVLCGNVNVGDHCFIGANSTVLQGLKIGSNTIIGGGSIVLRNVEDNVIRYGKIGGDN